MSNAGYDREKEVMVFFFAAGLFSMCTSDFYATYIYIYIRFARV